MPYFLQLLHGQSPLISGYIAAAMAAGWTLSEILSSGWHGAGIRRAIVSGPLFVLVGLLALAILMPVPSGGHWQALAPIVIALLLVGFGIGFGWPHLLTRILQVAPEADKDIAGASITTVQLFATAFRGSAGRDDGQSGGAERSGRGGGRGVGGALAVPGVRAGAVAGGIQRLALRGDRRRAPRRAILYKPRPRASARMALIQRR